MTMTLNEKHLVDDTTFQEDEERFMRFATRIESDFSEKFRDLEAQLRGTIDKQINT